jgi:hypothetical protein
MRNTWAWLPILAVFLVPATTKAASQSVDGVAVLHAEAPN